MSVASLAFDNAGDVGRPGGLYELVCGYNCTESVPFHRAGKCFCASSNDVFSNC